ncbi:hypothetical protein Salat_0304600 [Sesamum alatum]|uniref:Uncharacterized protein n=1 Tax=Sesamum alatum TaxID=300844 RepID=A0AAE2CYV2_9LAMI|nr:hypothetical protein Salat_0304600 [Sesamum alatum]
MAMVLGAILAGTRTVIKCDMMRELVHRVPRARFRQSTQHPSSRQPWARAIAASSWASSGRLQLEAASGWAARGSSGGRASSYSSRQTQAGPARGGSSSRLVPRAGRSMPRAGPARGGSSTPRCARV